MNEMQGRFCLLEGRLADSVFTPLAVDEETYGGAGGLIQVTDQTIEIEQDGKAKGKTRPRYPRCTANQRNNDCSSVDNFRTSYFMKAVSHFPSRKYSLFPTC